MRNRKPLLVVSLIFMGQPGLGVRHGGAGGRFHRGGHGQVDERAYPTADLGLRGGPRRGAGLGGGATRFMVNGFAFCFIALQLSWLGRVRWFNRVVDRRHIEVNMDLCASSCIRRRGLVGYHLRRRVPPSSVMYSRRSRSLHTYESPSQTLPGVMMTTWLLDKICLSPIDTFCLFIQHG